MADEIRMDLDNVKSSLTALVNDARGQWQPQTSALQSAFDQFQTAIGKLVASPGSGGLSDVAAARDQVKRATQNLLAALTPQCPSVSPSATM